MSFIAHCVTVTVIWMDGTWLCFYQKRSAWSMDQGSTKKRSAVHNFVPTVTKFCVMWEGLSLPHDTKFGNCRGEIVDRRMVFIWSLIHGSGWSRLIKAEPGRSHRVTAYNGMPQLFLPDVDSSAIWSMKNMCTRLNKNWHEFVLHYFWFGWSGHASSNISKCRSNIVYKYHAFIILLCWYHSRPSIIFDSS